MLINKYEIELIKFCKEINLDFLKNKSIMVTGASGLIGSYIVDVIMKANEINNNNTMVYAMVRNLENSKIRFEKYINNGLFNIINHDVAKELKINIPCNFIIHAASNANPKAFDEDPIGTIKANVNGTLNLLEYSRKYEVEKLVYISSSEIYGEPLNKDSIYKEDSMGVVNNINPRACYTESKRMAENICINYLKQYDVKSCIARVCFAYGPTFTKADNRVIPQFIRLGLNNEDIVLKSTGELTRSYAYIYDVVSGILKILSDGKEGEVYNISNKNSNVSIRMIAETVAKYTNVNLKFDLPEVDKNKGYAPFSRSLLDSSKLEGIGWEPRYDINMGIKSIIDILQKRK